jgi:adenylosuccinate synthase
MAFKIVIGAQWGDEGKGKIVDVLSEDVDWIVRYQGGNNAGHTVEVGDEKFVLHLIPSGILHEGKRCVIGNGVVFDANGFIQEMDGLQERGFDFTNRLFISDRAHLVLPYHKLQDAGEEGSTVQKIGTTLRGIGPTYADKISRSGIRVGELLDPEFPQMLRERIEFKNTVLAGLDTDPLDADEIVADFAKITERLKPYIADTTYILHEAIEKNESVLFEGAQGTMLDIDHGSYPFVTSSNATAGGACTGSGIGPNNIGDVIGVCKAYTTRVGEGPFPSELLDETGTNLAKLGHEFGSTTGRPRRCGWFDAIVAKYSVMVNGITWWVITKLDVLDTFETISLCVAYELDGKRIERVPANIKEFARCIPIYEEMPGWLTNTSSVTSYDELPPNAMAYLKRIEALTGTPVGIASVGPRRSETLFNKPGLAPLD